MLDDSSFHASGVPLAFGLAEAHEWAEFSGDLNPIHFDLQRARDAGLDGLVVHGMLVLLPIKQAIGRLAAAKDPVQPVPISPTGWKKFHAVFRKPVPHDSISLLTLRARSAGLEFRLTAGDAPDERIRGSYVSSPSQTDWLGSHEWSGRTFHAIAPDAVQRFARTYPTVNEAWIALDACVFADFIRNRLDAVTQMVRNDFAQLRRPGTQGEVFVQVSHTVFFNAEALEALTPSPADLLHLSYAMSPAQVVASQDKLAGSVSLPVLLGNTLVMLVEIGLLARPAKDNPQPSNSEHHEHCPIPT